MRARVCKCRIAIVRTVYFQCRRFCIIFIIGNFAAVGRDIKVIPVWR